MIDMRTAPYATFLFRVTLGIFAIAHLYWKFFVRPDGFDGWWNGLNTAGYPNWVIFYVLSGEFLGALLLIPGIYTRWVALYALPLIIGAAQFWAVRKGFFFTGAGSELPILKKPDRKSTRLNSSHANISYAVFCLKKKKETNRC